MWNVSHWVKIKVLAEMHSFWRCWEEICSFVFSSCLSSLSCGCIILTSLSVITSSPMLTFLSLFDEDPCDYSHIIQNNFPISGSSTAGTHALTHALLPLQCCLCACVRALALVWTQTLIPCVTLGKSLSFSGSPSHLYTEMQRRGKSKEARQAEGKQSL